MAEQRQRELRFAFGHWLRELRARRGVSQDGLARRTGVHETAIARFERGVREPRLTTILRLARGLDVNPGGLVESGDEEEGVTVERDGADLDPDTARVAFAIRLRKIRGERGLFQKEVAQGADLHKTALSRFERGEREPGLTMILRLAHGLGIKPRELVDGLERETARRDVQE